MAKPAKTKPVTAAELLNGPDGAGTATSGTTQAETGSTDATSLANSLDGAASTASEAPTSEIADPLADKADTGTAVADMMAATAIPSTGATPQGIAPGAADLTAPAAPISGEALRVEPETPQLGAAAGDNFKVRTITDLTGPASALAISLTGLSGAIEGGQLPSPVVDDEEERRWFPVASPILRDNQHYGVGDPIKVTETEHKVFRASQCIAEEWDDE